MPGRVLAICGFTFILLGCAGNEPLPEIVQNSHSEFEPPPQKVVTPQPSRPSTYENIPTDWLPPPRLEKKWTAIVIHHSATETGNAKIFDKMHREENHWDGVGYDFVIGNGTDSRDGQVEVTFRWREQKTGAHCGGTPDNWANEDGIGICLVGHFDHTAPTPRQIQSLAKLVRFLQKRYGISTGRIYGHNRTPGARVTACPGARFPMARFKRMLGS
jgi:N-acetyl-anhydromuramyl-L-alanine amidase AmpD